MGLTAEGKEIVSYMRKEGEALEVPKQNGRWNSLRTKKSFKLCCGTAGVRDIRAAGVTLEYKSTPRRKPDHCN